MNTQRLSVRLALLTLCAFTVPALALDATSADNLVAAILGQLGRTKGVVSIPNCGNGQLARAFLAGNGMKVHAIDASQANVDATRMLLEPFGKIGPVVTVEKCALTVMPYVNRFVDCMVITNLVDADLSTLPYSEIERVLAPDGLAFIGRATAEGAGMTQAALQSWINAAAKSRSTAVVSAVNGTWAVITGRELSGIDVWPKHAYDASNSNYSKDSVAGFPWMPQAKLKPYQSPFGTSGTTVTSGGRLYEVAQDIGVAGTTPPVMLRAYSIYNGELLWSRNVTGDGIGGLGGDPIRAYNRDVYLMRSSGILQLNGMTGAEIGTVSSVPAYPLSNLTRPTQNQDGCGPHHNSAFYGFNGRGVIEWDYRTNTIPGGHYYKPPCGIVGTIISNGMLAYMRPTCTCGQSRYWGSHIDGPAGTFQFDRNAAADGSDRLDKGPAFGAVSVQVIPDEQDWPTHRANNSRSGGSRVAVPNTASSEHLVWNWSPPFNYVTQVTILNRDWRPEMEPTPPAVAGQYTFIGGTDGYVRCIDNTTGSQKWSYLTGSRIYATPTVYGGCVYVGSGDGYAYCFEAHTGRLVWRFRAAPAEMRFNLYGYLSSVWPILTGVLVDASGNAYFAAGMQSEYGTHVYCVNGATGALRWQNNTSGTNLNPANRMGVAPCGYMAIARNKLVLANTSPATASYDLATGALDPTLTSLFAFLTPSWNVAEFVTRAGVPIDCAARGREVGFMDNAYFVSGGCFLFRDYTCRARNGFGQQEIGFQAIDANGTPKFPVSKISCNTSITPVWDDQTYYQVMAGDRRLEGYPMSQLSTTLSARMALPATSYVAGTNQDNGPSDLNTVSSWMPSPLFSNKTLYFNAVALAPNALVATYSKTDPSVPESVSWYVGTLNRTTGATLWEIALPDVGTGFKGQPLAQGLAIDRNGNIIVTLYNGNVLCYGGGAVSVATAEPAMPAVAAGRSAVAEGTVWTTAQPFVTGQQSGTGLTALSRGAAYSPVVDLAGAPAGSVVTVGLELPQKPYNAAMDSSDMVEVNGVLRHSLPPSERAVASAYRPRDTRWSPEQECLAVTAVTASSSARACKPGATIDRDLTSRWSPSGNGRQFITYDLGSVQEVSAVSVVWYASKASRTAFAIETSTDGRQFAKVDQGALTGRGTITTLRTFVTQEARYVRVILDAPVSVYEVGIHGGTVDNDQRADAK